MTSPLQGEDPRFESGWAHSSLSFCEKETLAKEKGIRQRANSTTSFE
jgi:hypothetical protein